MSYLPGERLRYKRNDIDDYDDSRKVFIKLEASNNGYQSMSSGNNLPSNAQDYLKSVRQQARNCKQTVVAKLPHKSEKNCKHLKIFAEKKFPGGEFKPNGDWQIMVMERFRQSRALYIDHCNTLSSLKKNSDQRPKLPLSPLPPASDKEAWTYFCLGNMKKPKVQVKVESQEEKTIKALDMRSITSQVEDEFDSDNRIIELHTIKKGFPPLMRILARLNTNQVTALIQYSSEWIKEYGFSHEQGSWIYALLVIMPEPVYPAVHGALRELSRTCAKERTVVDRDDVASLNALNSCCTIVCLFFKQYDLADK